MKEDCCGRWDYWKSLIKSAYGLATTSVRRAKVGADKFEYPDGDGTIDLTDIVVTGSVESVNGKTGEVILSAGDIDMTDGRDVETAIGAIEDELGTDVDGINSRITELNTKVTKNGNDIVTANKAIESESSTRALNDTELASQITAEENARKSGDSALQSAVDGKQAKLTAGTGINISANNVISATSTPVTYTAGDGIEITADHKITNTDHAQVATNKSDIATINSELTNKASVSALNTETSARTSADTALGTRIDGKQDALTDAQLNACNSGITKQNYLTVCDQVSTLELGKADKTTVDALGTSLNNAFSEFAISDNQLSMTTIGGTTYSQTLPTSGGGGDNWELITSLSDITKNTRYKVLISPVLYITATSWTTAPHINNVDFNFITEHTSAVVEVQPSTYDHDIPIFAVHTSNYMAILTVYNIDTTGIIIRANAWNGAGITEFYTVFNNISNANYCKIWKLA